MGNKPVAMDRKRKHAAPHARAPHQGSGVAQLGVSQPTGTGSTIFCVTTPSFSVVRLWQRVFSQVYIPHWRAIFRRDHYLQSVRAEQLRFRPSLSADLLHGRDLATKRLEVRLHRRDSFLARDQLARNGDRAMVPTLTQ